MAGVLSMADPLSITASLIAVLELTASVVKCLTDIQEDSNDCSEILVTVSTTSGILSTLRDSVDTVDQTATIKVAGYAKWAT